MSGFAPRHSRVEKGLDMNQKGKAIETRFRPHPFWSWNERLDTAETARQVRLMGEAGIGGFFMHARGGLQPTRNSGLTAVSKLRQRKGARTHAR